MLACVYTERDRNKFFESTLKSLYEAATKGYESLYASCILKHDVMHQKYPDIPFLSSTNELVNMRLHAYSKSVLPHDSKHLIPLFCNGDGNCLYKYEIHTVLPEI